jgi:hypothetical protein
MAINMSIAALKNKISISGGMQRDNRYLVTIYSNIFDDTGANAADSTNGGKQSYYAENVLLPNVSLITQADGLAGPSSGRTVPRGLSYRGGVQITFPIFGDLKFLQGMNDWMKKALYIRENNFWYTNFYSDAIKNANSYLTVDLLDLNGNKKGIYKFEEAFPVEIAPIQLSATKANGYMSVIIRFAFREYTFEQPTT